MPLWKVRREFHRLYEHIWALAGLVYEPFLKWRHDRWRGKLAIPPDKGAQLTGKVAVVLVYQPRGIPASMLSTLRHLVEQGYAPLVISNAQLSAKDWGAISPVVWRAVERPNFGYDFGGYRDGILLLRSWGVRPDRLILMNDSIWMPLRPGSTLLARLEAVAADIVGGVQHPDRTRKRTKTVSAGYIESYLYLINRTAWDHPAFAGYWQSYRVSSNKLNAVYRGERGFSRRMAAAGLNVRGLFSAALLIEALQSQSDEVLQLTLQYGAYTEADLAGERAALLARPPSSPGWRTDVLAHIKRTTDRRRFNASFPYPCDSLFGMDFMKKSVGPGSAGTLPLHSQMRQQMLRAVAAGDLPTLLPEVLAEIEALEPPAR
jgi:Rhamnan synthesis protein F